MTEHTPHILYTHSGRSWVAARLPHRDSAESTLKHMVGVQRSAVVPADQCDGWRGDSAPPSHVGVTFHPVPAVHTRAYRDDEPVEVGDVVRIDGDVAAFGTSIVRHIGAPTGALSGHGKQLVQVHLERPHARVSVIGAVKGTVFHAAEDHAVELDRFRALYEVFVTGASGKKDNRA